MLCFVVLLLGQLEYPKAVDLLRTAVSGAAKLECQLQEITLNDVSNFDNLCSWFVRIADDDALDGLTKIPLASCGPRARFGGPVLGSISEEIVSKSSSKCELEITVI